MWSQSSRGYILKLLRVVPDLIEQREVGRGERLLVDPVDEVGNGVALLVAEIDGGKSVEREIN